MDDDMEVTDGHAFHFYSRPLHFSFLFSFSLFLFSTISSLRNLFLLTLLPSSLLAHFTYCGPLTSFAWQVVQGATWKTRILY
ncbi:hypothetical protein BDW62DRAFT_175856 [Aspergillus aurantiobrunneus]